ncbi:PREDICTED: uncharacterized protein C17orf80 homolog isoform X2 [Myotis brandtii]|uniref:uncharacterized protein C17orf80 homolog isoform X2 n=1 Tax=Myotis brandtii TaxID=109478 RepID=UPI0007046FF0|nr:PREDICTED: uncharacterized protein C17orf80 homolog isoform X2 [Myotis brandtii]
MSPLRRPSGSSASGQGCGEAGLGPGSCLAVPAHSAGSCLTAFRTPTGFSDGVLHRLTWKPNLILLNLGSASGKHGDPGETTAELAPAYGKQLGSFVGKKFDCSVELGTPGQAYHLQRLSNAALGSCTQRLDQVQHHREKWSWWRHDALHWILHSLL